MPQKIQVLLLAIIGLIYFMSFNGSLPVTDPVESNYALTAKEMVQSGDYLSPQIYGKYWFDKPIMIYWLIAVSYNLFGGISEFATRLPAGIFSVMSVLLVYWFSYRIYRNPAGAMLAALILATSLEFWVLGKMILTDSVLFFFSSASMATFYLGLYGQKNNFIWFMLAYALAALAVLTKGPIGIVMPAITIFIYIAFKRRWSLFKKIYFFPGLAVFFFVAAPWYLAMYSIHGQDFIAGFLGLHNYIRATVSEHPSDNVIYYYLVVFPLSLMPWAGALVLFLKDIKCQMRFPANSYLLVWALVIIVFYTFMATKYLTYVFPALFPTAILLGNFLDEIKIRSGRWIWLWVSLPAAVLFLTIGFSAGYLSKAISPFLIYAVVSFALLAVFGIQLRGDFRQLPWVVAFSVMLVSMVFISSGLTHVANERSAKGLAAMLSPGELALASYGDYATSMVFYSGHQMPRLRDTKESNSNVWNLKYTMPVETPEEFLMRAETKPNAYILVKGVKEEQLAGLPVFESFNFISKNRNMLLFER